MFYYHTIQLIKGLSLDYAEKIDTFLNSMHHPNLKTDLEIFVQKLAFPNMKTNMKTNVSNVIEQVPHPYLKANFLIASTNLETNYVLIIHKVAYRKSKQIF